MLLIREKLNSQKVLMGLVCLGCVSVTVGQPTISNHIKLLKISLTACRLPVLGARAGSNGSPYSRKS